MSNTAVTPYYAFTMAKRYLGREIDDSVYFSLVKKHFFRYYIGISDLRGKGKLVDQGMMPKIEKQLSLKGMVLALEIAEQVVLAEIIRPLRRRLIDNESINLTFRLIGDSRNEVYTVNEINIYSNINQRREQKLVVFDSHGQEGVGIDPKKMVIFYNNEDNEADLVGIDIFLARMKEKLDYIDYDATKCRKKMAIFSPGRIAPKDWQYFIDGYESSDYFLNIAYDESLKKGKKAGNFSPEDVSHQIIGVQNSTEREQLWRDYLRLWAETCKYFGIQFNVGWKEERQNISEVGLIQAPFKAWEKERKWWREEALRKCEKIPSWLEPGWELVYGGQTETGEQKIQRLEQELKIMDLEEQIEMRKQQKKLEVVEQRNEKVLNKTKKVKVVNEKKRV